MTTSTKAIEHLTDGENSSIQFDFAYSVHGNLMKAIEQIQQQHAEQIYWLPISGASAGSGIFQTPSPPSGIAVGLRFEPPISPQVRTGSCPELSKIDLDEVIIDPTTHTVCAGSAVTLDQLNQALADQLGDDYMVAGADLTSYQYAAVGATFMTGGMGPQRRYFSDSVIAACLYDGSSLIEIEGDQLLGFAGSYGWTGIISAVKCRYNRYPKNEIAFALPVSNQPQALANVLGHLAPLCYLQWVDHKVRSNFSESDLILGIEHVKCSAMQPLLASAPAASVLKRAQSLQQACDQAGADAVLFVIGLSDQPSDVFLQGLLDDSSDDALTIAGVDLAEAQIFERAAEMRDLREAIPYAARMQMPNRKYHYKNHSDANIRLNPLSVAISMARLWQINQDYVDAVEEFFSTDPDISGQILVYGHLNPYGVDPHNRVTMSCDSLQSFQRGRQHLVQQRAHFYRSLLKFCENSDGDFIGGEKAAHSELSMLEAFADEAALPQPLDQRFKRQRDQIRQTNESFSWRAPELYRTLRDDQSSD